MPRVHDMSPHTHTHTGEGDGKQWSSGDNSQQAGNINTGLDSAVVLL
jgi:hypothetical protein